MKTITIREEFLPLKDFAHNLPQTFDSQGLVIHNSRNVIKKIDTPQGTFVVKHFKGMYFFNRLAYSLFRQSKAARSYQYSNILNEKGIATPPHVAWIDCYTLGLLTRSYFVSVFSPHKTLAEILQHYDVADVSGKQSLLRHLAAFVLKLHRLGVFHEDLSPGNILIIPAPDGYDFALLDLNRIKFRQINFRNGVRNFITLSMPPTDLNVVIGEYAERCGMSAEAALDEFWKYEKRRSSLRRFRRKLRRYTLKPFEDLFRENHPLAG